MKNTKKHKKTNKKVIIADQLFKLKLALLFLLSLIVLDLVYEGCRSVIFLHQGVYGKAVIYKKKVVKRKKADSHHYYYEFHTNGNLYTRHTGNIGKRIKFNDVKIGDSLEIVYLPYMPKLNLTKSEVEYILPDFLIDILRRWMQELECTCTLPCFLDKAKELAKKYGYELNIYE